MHSSRMCTVRSSSRLYSQGGVCSGGGLLQGGVCSRGCLVLGVPGPVGPGHGDVPASGGGGCLILGGGIPACNEADTPCEQND